MQNVSIDKTSAESSYLHVSIVCVLKDIHVVQKSKAIVNYMLRLQFVQLYSNCMTMLFIQHLHVNAINLNTVIQRIQTIQYNTIECNTINFYPEHARETKKKMHAAQTFPSMSQKATKEGVLCFLSQQRTGLQQSLLLHAVPKLPTTTTTVTSP